MEPAFPWPLMRVSTASRTSGETRQAVQRGKRCQRDTLDADSGQAEVTRQSWRCAVAIQGQVCSSEKILLAMTQGIALQIIDKRRLWILKVSE